MNPMKIMYEKSGLKVCENLKKRFFDAHYASTKEEALKKALELIPKEHTVSWGGSLTMEQLGLKDALKKQGYNLLDRDSAATPQEKADLMRQAFFCGTYVMGANAVTFDGQLLNVDGNGNRVAALCYGPKTVLVLAGMNKVVKSLDDALSRVRNIAAPANKQRFENLKTPCSFTGQCADCRLEESICNQFVLTRLCRPKGRIKVVLIGEDLGL